MRRNFDVRTVHGIKTVKKRLRGQVAYVGGVELCTENINRIRRETQSSMEVGCSLKMGKVE